ncbi:MAG: hypothetical protein IKQ93_05110 [Candidatus Methanomethylophilaceae archaeon]|nr:hypothetical protein [Candidatus Methanomethylophilaceae archaeon]
MIALTISDLMDANAACKRIAELTRRNITSGAPDAICIRNDSFSEDQFSSLAQLVGELWEGHVIIESDYPTNVSKALLHLMDRKPLIVGANRNNLEQFSTISKLFGYPMCISCEDMEELFDLVQQANNFGATDIVLDPMMRNMKQCLESCTDLKRLSKKLPEADHPVAVRTWSGEYAMTMAMVSLLVGDAIVIADDLDADSCETIGELVKSIG